MPSGGKRRGAGRPAMPAEDKGRGQYVWLRPEHRRALAAFRAYRGYAGEHDGKTIQSMIEFVALALPKNEQSKGESK